MDISPSRGARTDHLVGEIDFASPELVVQRTAELMGAGALVVNVPALPASMRGRLAQHVDESIENELALRGSPSPWLADWAEMPRDAAARLADQLFRARTLGATGIAISIGTIADERPISPEDSATLVLLAQTTGVAPLVVMLDDGDESAKGYAAPMELAALIGMREAQEQEAAYAGKPSQAEVDGDVDVHAEGLANANAPANANADAPLSLSANADADADANAPAANAPALASPSAGCSAPASPSIPAKTVAARAQVLAEARPTVGHGWRTAVDSLSSIRGPLPLSAFEKYFVESYVPLTAAIEEGLDDPRALHAHDEFRRAFEHAYTESFAAFGATTRRPRLVMDLYDYAAKQARLHNARSSHVLLVDSMRWDLGLMFRDTFAAATLTAETILFSSLPTTTLRQLETLARGIDALRDPAPGDMIESLRGRSADHVRRLRVGSRELFKLDTIPAMLETAADFEEMMEHVVAAVTRHAETLPARTLLVVAGDHGFTLDKNGLSAHGGASPEEVLVPAFSYLLGDLH